MKRGYILYDDHCMTCIQFITLLTKQDTKKIFILVPLRSARARTLLPHMNMKKLFSSFHVITPDKKVYSGGNALHALLSYFPKRSFLTRIRAIPGSAHLFKLGYAIGKQHGSHASHRKV